jgi:aminoglycoside phosphotransferase (APT) family kinase protein
MLNLEVIGQGATTKIYRDGDTAIKLYENAPPGEAEKEAEKQRFARDAGLSVPAVYGVRQLGSAVALDMQLIEGQPILRPGMTADERNAAILTLARLQCEMHRVVAAGLPPLTGRLGSRIQSGGLEEPVKAALLARLGELADDSESLCHGDFHPLNVLYDGSKYWIIDWVDATAGNPLADACRSYLLLRQHISRSAGVYLKAFCAEAGAKPDDVLAWLPVVAAARLSENMDDKSRGWLLGVVGEWYGSAPE